MDISLLEYVKDLGPSGALLVFLLVVGRYLLTKDRSEKEERATKDESAKEERRENREHEERVFNKIADATDHSTATITTALTGLTSIVEKHDAKTEANIASCKDFRAEVRSQLKD